MSCCYCSQSNLKESRHYNIENVRQRFIPTYFHSQIFGTTQPLPSKVRCTPTFHSQALRVDNYGHNCKGKCQKKVAPVQKKTVQQVDMKKTTKQGDFPNARGKSCYNSRVKWYDQEKNQKFNHIHNNYDYSRQRKFADLASSSVFEGYVYQHQFTQNQLCRCVNCQCYNCKCGKQNNGDCECVLPKKKVSPGCQCKDCACVNCQCGSGKAVCGQCQCDEGCKNKQYEQVQKQGSSCKNCKCVNCACDKCQCGPAKQQESQKDEKRCQRANCNCVDCKCLNCNGGNCKCGVSQVNAQQSREQPKITINEKNEQVTFGKKGTAKLQKGISQPKKVTKEKPSFTVIRQKR